MTTDPYTAAEAAAELGVSQSRVRQLAQDRSAGWRTIDGWRFSRADLDRMARRPAGRPPQRVRDYLTLSPEEATLIVAMLNGHLRTPGVSGRDELLFSLLDSVGPDADGDRLDTRYGVADWRSLVVRTAALSEAQADGVLNAAKAFWAHVEVEPWPAMSEGLMEVGFLGSGSVWT